MWEELVLAYLHDPPDKVLDIPGHVNRARRYLAAVLGHEVDYQQVHQLADQLVSSLERLPTPRSETLTISPEQGKLVVYHPLVGEHSEVPPEYHIEPIDVSQIEQQLRDIVQGLDDTRCRFLALWRLLPERLIQRWPWFSRLPADTRIPDHTIWQHLDITTALKAADAGGQGAAFLSFALGPVQSFIATARSVRDLWSGSMILSWLTFQAMLPIIEEYGPAALVYPALRGLPFLDMWLRTQKGLEDRIEMPPEDLRLSPCLPNRFLALVPWGAKGQVARELARKCESRMRSAWQEIAEKVHQQLQPQLTPLYEAWDRRWQLQIDHFWEVRTAILPWRQVDDRMAARWIAGSDRFADAFPDAGRVRQLADAIPEAERPHYYQTNAGSWQAKVELSARLMQAQRTVRHIPPSTLQTDGAWSPPKCSLMGTYEQMGPDGLDDSRRFWEEAARRVNIGGVRLREGERLCAISLVKRFAAPAFFRKKLQLSQEALRFEDTASVAAAVWLKNNPDLRSYSEKQRSSHWLYWGRPNQEEDKNEPTIPEDIWRALIAARKREAPPAYYAILMMDGDHMGGWLRGDHAPEVRGVIHPQLVQYYEKCNTQARQALQARRPVGPALHAAISTALVNFALHFAPHIVEKYHGTLIYAGGDDVLALLPTSEALACASQLRTTYRQEWGQDDAQTREYLLMGRRATLSAGLVIAHYKEDLRYALQEARRAEKAAKEAGRDALQILVLRRSGEHTSALCPWDFLPTMEQWVKAFLPAPNQTGASDRWVYHLYGELATLEGLDIEAVAAEIRRQLQRAEEDTCKRFHPQGEAGNLLAGHFRQYHKIAVDKQKRFSTSRAIREFVILLQTASFIARGREQ
jgi:CRISPR-associated protein Cmr2